MHITDTSRSALEHHPHELPHREFLENHEVPGDEEERQYPNLPPSLSVAFTAVLRSGESGSSSPPIEHVMEDDEEHRDNAQRL